MPPLQPCSSMPHSLYRWAKAVFVLLTIIGMTILISGHVAKACPQRHIPGFSYTFNATETQQRWPQPKSNLSAVRNNRDYISVRRDLQWLFRALMPGSAWVQWCVVRKNIL